jgi:hypothetical protein
MFGNATATKRNKPNVSRPRSRECKGANATLLKSDSDETKCTNASFAANGYGTRSLVIH